MKKLALDRPQVLSAVIKVYQYWIALTDCDGFRIDAVRHISWHASRYFCGAIREYAESIGKENFLLLGEVTGGAASAAVIIGDRHESPLACPTTEYLSIAGWEDSTTETDIQSPIPRAGTVGSLYVYTAAGMPSGESLTLTIPVSTRSIERPRQQRRLL